MGSHKTCLQHQQLGLGQGFLQVGDVDNILSFSLIQRPDFGHEAGLLDLTN
jgi:hypothetical protein